MHSDTRFLGLDIGTRRVGVALSDPLKIIAKPFKTLEIKSNEGFGKKIFKAIIQIIIENKVELVVAGIPYDLNGGIGEQASKTLEFIELLKNTISERADLQHLKVVTIDERFSSSAAESFLIGSKLKNKNFHAAVDMISASIILSAYMESIKI